MKCLLAIPCFRESRRLPPFLEALCHALERAPFQTSIVIVDDGSGPAEAAQTRGIVEEFRGKYPRLIADAVFLEENCGKGGAVYAGWAMALRAGSGVDLLCFVDADGSVPAGEVVRLIGELATDQFHEWDAVFGSRVKLLGRDVKRVAARHYIGRVFATLTTLFTGLEVYDSQCGLKVLRCAAFAAIETELREMRFVFDVELALLLLEREFRIREIPIHWQEVPGSKVHVLHDGLRMFLGLLRIRSRKSARKAGAK